MDVVIRAALMYCFLLFLTRMVGRRELSTLEPFDLILLIVLGDLIQQGVTQSDYSFTGLMLASGTIAVMQTSVSWIGYRSPEKAGLVLEGEPIVIVQDGKCLERNTKRERMTRGRSRSRPPARTGSAPRRGRVGHPRDERQDEFIKKSA